MILNEWDDVKLYPRVTEVLVYCLLLLSLLHSCVATKRGYEADRVRPLVVWLSVLLLTVSWEIYSATVVPKWHPVCYPKSMIMFRNCHSLWGMLRHVPLAYSAWAIGTHKKFAVTLFPCSFMSCCLFLFYTLSFESFGLCNKLLRYNHKVELLNATIFFRVPAIVVALYFGALLALPPSTKPTNKEDNAGVAATQKTRDGLYATSILKRSVVVIVTLLAKVVGTALRVALGAVLVGGGLLVFSMKFGDNSHEEEEDSFNPDSAIHQLMPKSSPLSALVPALLPGMLLVYLSVYIYYPMVLGRENVENNVYVEPDYLLFAIPTLFYFSINTAILLRTTGLDDADHVGMEARPDDISNLHVELANPAKVFIVVNTIFALWASLRGCSIPLFHATNSVSLLSTTDDETQESNDK